MNLQSKAVKYATVCSGIEAPSVAMPEWEPLWFSEIDPFPCAVLEHRYPAVPNVGDMTQLPAQIATGLVEAPEVLIGGTPCQAFSVAGMREGLQDGRGQLTLTFVELADEIDKARIDACEPECVIVWENVPGVLSSKDNAFGCFLGALAGEDCELQPAGEKWTNAGCVHGPQRTVAWRVLDAQHFGLAQRRRRVFVVASARRGFDPAAVLFESEGVRRDTPPSREALQDTPASVAGRPELRRGCGYEFPDTLGEYGCPNCEGDEGPAKTANQVSVVATNAEGSTGLPFLTCSNIGKTVNNQTPLLAMAVHGTKGPNVRIDHAPAPGRNNGAENAVQVTGLVRRLTPIECERLMGFPANYTRIPWRGATPDNCPDGHRYKALGNSMAVPIMRWLCRRISFHLSR